MSCYTSQQDKGYAYVILLASLLGHTLQYGVVWTVGVFFAIFVEVFPDNSGTVALISSLNTAFYYGAGPLSSFLTNKFGPRVVSIIGALVGSTGLVLSMYANNVYTLYVTFGVIAGFGLGLSYIPTVTTVGIYFEKYRSVALGIAVSGCGLGTFIFPPVIRAFITYYGWRGALLLVGGLMLNMCVCGALLRPFNYDKTEKTSESKDKKSKSDAIKHEDEVSKSLINIDEKVKHEYNNSLNVDEKPKYKFNNSLHDFNKNHNKANSLLNLKQSEINSTGNSLLNVNKPHGNSMTQSLLNVNNKKIDGHDVSSSLFNLNLRKRTENLSRSLLKVDQEHIENLNRSLLDILNVQNPVSHNENTHKSIDNKLGSYNNIDDNASVDSTKNNLLNLFIFKNVNYLLLCLNNFFVCFGLSIVYVHLAAYATSTGIDGNKSALLFSVIGIANFIGRIAFGIIGHIPNMNHTSLYTVIFFLSGIVTAICPLYKSYAWFFAYASAFGFLTGCFGTLLPQCVIQILEIQYLTSGYGYLLIFEAMGTLLGAPVAGWLYVWSEEYDNSLYLGGAVLMFSSIVMIYPMLFNNRRKGNNCCCKNVDTHEPYITVEVTNEDNV